MDIKDITSIHEKEVFRFDSMYLKTDVFVCENEHGWSEQKGEFCPECGERFIKKYKRSCGFFRSPQKL